MLAHVIKDSVKVFVISEINFTLIHRLKSYRFKESSPNLGWIITLMKLVALCLCIKISRATIFQRKITP